MKLKKVYKLILVFLMVALITVPLSGCLAIAAKDHFKDKILASPTPTPIEAKEQKEEKSIGESIDDLSSSIGNYIGEGLGNFAEDLGNALGSDLSGIGKEEKEPDLSKYPDLKGPYHIYSVVDGDTVKIKEFGTEVRNRLIGLDCPESVASDEYLEASGKENTQEGKDASEFLKSYLKQGDEVWIEWDAQQNDKYDRQLIYLYTVKDGKLVFVNELLLKEGYATLYTMQPNVKHVDALLDAQKYAIENEKGFWATGFFEDE